ncbi:probable WRKY transcription factor 41 [Zingiber officinale]|uniref:probable WRKY transcription factor 41 n=1 Tax=Zingiber officinale TaxID=94328 RepID=UPI001C4CC07F|nr:probable WRKY transcription factor 41 [Zingiber officinale]
MNGAVDVGSLLRLLSQAEQQTRQLIGEVNAAENHYHREVLLQQILSNLKEAIATAKLMEPEPPLASHLPPQVQPSSSPPVSNCSSPRSESSERVLFKEHERREMCKKRKTLPKWTNRVRVVGGRLAEGLEDGHSWRKYGQKEILGAMHPRGYYRCTHRNTAGCLATKQVQRLDDDPCVFDITYRGDHTCLRNPQALLTPAVEEPATSQSHDRSPPLLQEIEDPLHEQQSQALSSDFFLPCSSNQMASFPPQSLAFSSMAAVDHNNDCYTGSISPLFVSAVTWDSNHFSVTPSHVAVRPNATPDSELAEIVSAATLPINSPRMNANFMQDHVELSPSFNFDPSNFLG